MREWIRRLRAAAVMGVTWGVGWMSIGALVGFVLWIVGLDPTGLLAGMWFGARLFGLLGFLAGSLFSGVLRLAEGRRRFEELSLPRFTLWGAVGGLLLGGISGAMLFGGPGLQPFDTVVVAVTTLLGASSAAGTLALARQAGEDRLMEAGDEGIDRPESALRGFS